MTTGNASADNTPILSVRNLAACFDQDEGRILALDGVTFDVFRGRTLGLVGESGCGKSVTARCILRIVDRPGRILGGEILLEGAPGERPTDLVALDARSSAMRAIRGGRVSLVFQEPMTSLSAFYTVGNQIEEVVRKHQGKFGASARALAIKLLRDVGIPQPERRINEYPFQLSGGLRQRVMIAMALAGSPEILIADEPTTALDVTTQAQILSLLRDIQRKNDLALVLITHDLGVIAEMADEVAVMYLGRIVEHGPVEQIFKNPQHPYTRQLLRSIPDIEAEPKSRLAAIDGSVPHPTSRPQGCAFHPRCADVLPGVCDVFLPNERKMPSGGRVSCHRVENALEHP